VIIVRWIVNASTKIHLFKNVVKKIIANKFVVKKYPAWNALGTDLKVTESKLILDVGRELVSVTSCFPYEKKH